MGLAYSNNLTNEYKQNIYHIELNVSGWDTATFQVVAPVAATMYIYGTLDDGMPQGQLLPTGNYGAELALNWSSIQAVNLATGAAVNTIAGAGIYSVPVNTKYIKLGGGGADVYGLLQFNSKIS